VQQKYLHHHKAIHNWLRLIFLSMMLGACVSQPTTAPEPTMRPMEAGDSLFLEGEEALSRKDLDSAQPIFTNYLGQYPEGRFAPDAWQLIGRIYAQRGEDGPAEAFYRRAMTLFPQSPAADRARLGVADLYVKSNRIPEAIDLCHEALANGPEMNLRIDIWQRLAHLYQVTGDSADATLYAYLIYKNIPAPEDEVWMAHLQESVTRLDPQAIDAIWDRIEDRQIRGFLIYRYATAEIEHHNYAAALEVLSAFRGAFPGHPFDQAAAEWIRQLTERLHFEPYTVGCLLPLSGAYETYGRRALNAVEMALSLIQTGETALPVRLVVKDTASEDDIAVQGVRDLEQAGAGVIIGPIAAASAAASEAQRLNIPIVTFTQKTGITEVGDFVFRHFISPHDQVRTLVDYFVHHLYLRNFAIMYPRESYGATFMALFWDEVTRQGGRVVGAEGYDPQQTDFAVTIQKLVGTHYEVPSDLRAKPVVQVESHPYYHRRSVSAENLSDVLSDPVTRLTGLFFQDPDQDRVKGPAIGRITPEDRKQSNVDFDVLFIPDAPKATGLILPQLAYHDVEDIYLVGTNLWHSQQLIDMSWQYAQDAVMVDGFFKESASEAVRGFVETYRSIYGHEPGVMEAFAFDTTNLILTLMARGRIEMRQDLRDAMKDIYLARGVTGATAFANNGEAIKRLSLLRIKGDKFVEIALP